MFLLNPHHLNRAYPDERSAEVMRKTVEFFETKGLRSIKDDDHAAVWYQEFIDFLGRERIFATMCTPSDYGGDDTRWDTWRICEFGEILAFYGLPYWYVYQVTVLGLGPVWMSDNEAVKERAAALLDEGAIFAFGLSEKGHGADLYSTDMTLTPTGDGKYVANGSKYYIGNGNQAAIVSTFGKFAESGEYCFFAADSQHPDYHLIKNVTHTQNYVAEYALDNYPVTDADLLSRGPKAWDDALNTVNIGKYNLGWASIGMATHALYEAIHHAANRHLYGMTVTDFPHVKRLFTDAYARLVAMKLVALRAADYMRSASPDDRRYLLYNPVVKMKVTTQGEDVINHLWDVIAAKGFEEDTFFEMASRDIRALPKLEGTVHVNIALIVKFMENYFFHPADLPPVERRDDAANDDFLFDQGPTRGLRKIRFHDYKPTFERSNVPNVAVFAEQAETFKEMLAQHPPTEVQTKDTDWLLAVGELFTLVVYAQLVLENAEICGIDDDLIDEIFDVTVRDFSRFAVGLFDKAGTTAEQGEFCTAMIRKPVDDEARYRRVWEDHVLAQCDAYEMPE
ncbi:MAG TPA: acyl-CoA dehydrogenase [Acidimicrobiia bacterium]|nr:acyl-CoA dehydrogenase [Acidimicrobiia bacterium]